MEAKTQTEAATVYDAIDADTNDITKKYAVGGALGRLISEFEDLQDAATGCKVTGEGSTGNFASGWYEGDEPATVSRKFTIGMDVRAYRVEGMRSRINEWAGDLPVEIDVDVRGSTTRGVPLWKDGRMVAAKFVPDLEEDEYDYNATVEITVDITDVMTGAPDGVITDGDVIEYEGRRAWADVNSHDGTVNVVYDFDAHTSTAYGADSRRTDFKVDIDDVTFVERRVA